MTDDDFADRMIAFGLERYKRDGYHSPILIGIDDDGLAFVSLANFDNEAEKDLAALQMRQLLQAHNCIGYLFISEAWLSNVGQHEEYPENRIQRLPPSKDPARIDTLWMIVHYPSGRRRMLNWEVDRGRVIDRLQDMEIVGNCKATGRFVDLLQKEPLA